MQSIRIKFEAASKGISIGHAHIITSSASSYPKFWVPDKEIASEIARFKRAIQKSKQQLTKVKEKLCRFQAKDQIQIIDSHAMLLQDEMVITHAIDNISKQKINAEWALDKAVSLLKMAFADVKDEYFRQRKNDIDYVAQRIIRNLLGSASELTYHDVPHHDIVLVAHDISPADIANLNRQRIKGFVTATGGFNSHSAIIARSLEIPAMFGVEDIMSKVAEGDNIVIDGIKGCIVIRPPKNDLKDYKKRQQVYEKAKNELLKDAHLPAETKDGSKMALVANIELVEEIESAVQHGAEGIGLFRTEYLFANRMDVPSEEEQFECYKTALEKMAPHPTTIRTIDLGGDKLFINSDYADHINPALGLRAIRFCLAERDLFHTQLRALYRASVFGNLQIMVPMISGIDELRQVKKIIASVQKELSQQKIKFNPKTRLGIMIEIPSAVLTADELAREADFFSIGTNDLIQYTLAVDRTNEHVAYLYNPLHPAVISMIKKTVDAAKSAGIEVTLCGEMAGDPLYLLLLLGIGLDALSMNPISIPRVKKLLRSITAKEAKRLFLEAQKLKTAEEIESFVKKEVHQHLKFFEQPKA